MSDKELNDLGVKTMGDRVKLRAFCQGATNVSKGDNRSYMKRQLSEILQRSKSRRLSQTTVKTSVKKKPAPPAGPKKPTLKFEVRWKHYVKGGGYKSRRSEQGGGVRTLDIPRHATANDCLEEMKNVFFPNGQSLVGNAEDMEFRMADFKCQTIYLCDDFSPEGYKQRYKLHTPRLFLLSKDNTISSDDSDDDQELHESPFESSGRRDEVSTNPAQANAVAQAEESTAQEAESQFNSIKENNQPDVAIVGVNSVHTTRGLAVDDLADHATDGLIGTSEERKELMDQLQVDYEASLAADKEKELEKEANDLREALRLSRQNRVLHEPATEEPRVTVSVRHPILGVIKRAFPPDCKIVALYDWVGSLSTYPEHFALCFSPQCIIYPEEDINSVASSMLCMSQRDFPIPLCRDDDEVAFFSAQPDNGQDETLPDAEFTGGTDHFNDYVPNDPYKHLEEIQSHPPSQLLEDDPDLSPSEQEYIEALEGLNAKRRRVEEQLGNDMPMVRLISRHNCVKEMLTLFKDQSIVNTKLCLAFKGENAVGHGVLREVYSVFWDNFVANYCEGSSHFTFSVSAATSQEDFAAIGRILTHQFIQTCTIPLQISEAIMQQAVVGKVSEKCLTESFLMLLHEKERKILYQAINGVKPFPTEDAVEILSDYGVTNIPNTSNMKTLLLQVAETELISKPFMCITKLREGMGSFWKGVSGEEIHAVYSVCTSNHTNVLKNLEVMAEDQQEDKVSRWLTRYIKSKEHKLLCRFLRFCTGSDVVLPDRKIKVQLEHMSSTSMRPKAQTCFNILTVPKNYRTLAHLTENIDFYLCNPHLWELTD